MDPVGKIKCPKCGQIVDRVDGEYERHYVVANVLCTMALRQIMEEETGEDEASNGT